MHFYFSCTATWWKHKRIVFLLILIAFDWPNSFDRLFAGSESEFGGLVSLEEGEDAQWRILEDAPAFKKVSQPIRIFEPRLLATILLVVFNDYCTAALQSS